jgi:hypothetical protein
MDLDRSFGWLLRNRETDSITIVQAPNLPLATFIVAAVLRTVVHLSAALHTTVDIIAGAALLLWALWEVLRGVNPFRRILGAVVVVLEVIMFISR